MIGGELAFLGRVLPILAHEAHALGEHVLGLVDDRHVDACLREAHGDAATHRAGAHDGRLLNLGGSHALEGIDLADLPLGAEDVPAAKTAVEIKAR